MTNKSCTSKTSPHGFPEIREIFASAIRNLGNFHWSNRKSWALISGVQTKEYEIQESEFQVLDSRIHGVEYRIRGCLGFPYLEHFFFPVVLIVVLPLLLFSLSLPSLRFYHNMYVIPILYFFPFTFRLDNYWLYGFRRSHKRCNTSS